MNPETKFSKDFRSKLPKGHILRVENPAGPGTPDLNLCIRGVESWVEFKRVKKLPKSPQTPVFTGCLEPHQVLWHFNRSRAGGRSYIAGHVELEGLTYLIPGEYSREFNDMTRERLDELTVPLEELWLVKSC